MPEFLVILLAIACAAFMTGYGLATHRHRASERRKRELSFQLGNPVDLAPRDHHWVERRRA